MMSAPLERTAARDQVHDQDDDRDDEQQMNERATEVTDESEKPENQENNEDGPEHMFSFELVYFASRARVRLRVKIFQIRAVGNCWRPGTESTTTRLTVSTSFSMRIKLLLIVLLAVNLAGGAFAAVVVEKQSRQLPYVEVFECNGIHSFVFRGPRDTSRKPILVPPKEYWTVRESGLYKFVLRYHSGNVRARLVTPEVFARYRVGDDFRDDEAFTERVTEDSKTIQPMEHRRQHISQVRKHSRVSHRVAKHHRLHRSHLVAQR
jgi:hypothetical protein